MFSNFSQYFSFNFNYSHNLFAHNFSTLYLDLKRCSPILTCERFVCFNNSSLEYKYIYKYKEYKQLTKFNINIRNYEFHYKQGMVVQQTLHY